MWTWYEVHFYTGTKLIPVSCKPPLSLACLISLNLCLALSSFADQETWADNRKSLLTILLWEGAGTVIKLCKKITEDVNELIIASNLPEARRYIIGQGRRMRNAHQQSCNNWFLKIVGESLFKLRSRKQTLQTIDNTWIKKTTIFLHFLPCLFVSTLVWSFFFFFFLIYKLNKFN